MAKHHFDFLDWNNKVLLNSIKKIDLNIILTVILDALFYFLSGYLVIFWFQRIQEKVAAFNLPADMVSLGYEKINQLAADGRTFYYIIIFSFILLLIVIIFLAGILKGIIWAKTTKTKISLALISKFLGLNLVWMGFWFLLIFLISLLVQPQSVPIFMTITLILGIYFTNTLYTVFMKEQKLKTIFTALRLNITKIHMFLLPYALILLLIFIIIKLSNLLTFKYSAVAAGFIVLVYAAFVRYYVSELVLEVQK